MNERYDAIVVGVGAMGAAATAHLAERGVDVLGLERFDVPNGMGSSAGHTRIIRRSQHENPAYVPLVRRAEELWVDLEADADRTLLYRTGSVEVGPPRSELVAGAQRACAEHGIDHELLSGSALSDRYPPFSVPEESIALVQPDGGFLDVEGCLVAHVDRAHRAGARIHARERVVGWRPTGDGVRVETDQDAYRADRLVVTAGAWVARFVDELAGLITPERQVLAWLQPDEPDRFDPDRFPVWIASTDEGQFYGFPTFRTPGYKFGKFGHRGEHVDPDAFDRDPKPADERLLRSFAEEQFPADAGPTMGLKTCLFANTPDGEFVIDTLPDRPEVVVAAGFSGHGFKFASVVGEIVADLTLEGETDHDVDAFSIDRFDRA